MARSDLLMSVIKAGLNGNRGAVRNVTEAIIAEERTKNHKIFAKQLLDILEAEEKNKTTSTPNYPNGRNGFDDCVIENTPKKSLGDIVLSSANTKACNNFIEEQRRADLLRAHGIEPRNRILLIGPPGNGKTSLAEAIAEALAFSFFVIRYDSLITSYLGETAMRLRHVFDYARTTPCVLFFDEFDTLGKERGDKHETGEIKRVVSSLLLQIDSLPSYTVLIAATNHSELLDRAVWRRFQIRLELPYPTHEERIKYIDNFAKKTNGLFDNRSKEIAKKLGAVSFSDMEQFCFDVYRYKILSIASEDATDIINKQLQMRLSFVKEPESVKGLGDAKISNT